MVAAERAVSVEREGDVAVAAAAGLPAGPAVECGRHPTAVEEEDRLAAPLRDGAQLREERRREGIAGLPPQIDDADGRKRSGKPAAQLEPLQRLPRLRPRRRRPEDGDGMLERCALGGDRTRVVARLRLLLVGGIVLLVDADHAESGQRREDGRAGSDHDRGLAGGDPLALVTPLGLGEGRVENRHPLAEAGAEAAERLGCQRDLGHEHDRPETAGERRLAGADVDLGLAASGGARKEDVAPARAQQPVDPHERPLRRLGQPPRGGLGGERFSLGHRPPLAPALRLLRRDERQSARRSRAVVLGEPEGEVDERRGHALRDALHRGRLDALGRLDTNLGDDAPAPRIAEANLDDGATLHSVRHLVGEGAGDRAGGNERVDGGEAPHPASVLAGKVGAVDHGSAGSAPRDASQAPSGSRCVRRRRR